MATPESINKELKKLAKKLCCTIRLYTELPGIGQKGVLYVNEETGDKFVWNGTQIV